MAENTPPELDEITVGDIVSPPLRRLYDWWLAKGGDGRLPARRDFDPLDMRYILGNLILVDVLADSRRFRYRLTGTNLTRQIGFDPTGKMVDEHPDPTYRRIALYAYGRVATTATPFAARRDAWMDGRLRRYESLLLPLAGDGVNVDMILAGMWFR